MHWEKIDNEENLNRSFEQSFSTHVVLFKHSTRCSISSMALSRLERSWSESEVGQATPYLVDLVAHRDISNNIAHKTGVMHESPQVIILKDGKPVYNASHMGIQYSAIKEKLKEIG
jgi:bacillithiol system protein YtxJ